MNAHLLVIKPKSESLWYSDCTVFFKLKGKQEQTSHFLHKVITTGPKKRGGVIKLSQSYLHTPTNTRFFNFQNCIYTNWSKHVCSRFTKEKASITLHHKIGQIFGIWLNESKISLPCEFLVLQSHDLLNIHRPFIAYKHTIYWVKMSNCYN